MDKLHTHSDQSCCDGKVDLPQVTDKTHTDPVCGMQTAADSNKSVEHSGITYYFCSQHCIKKFRANPQQYLKPQTTSTKVDNKAAAKGALYTCPMHPEVQQVGPGNCPKCGMALEPMDATTEEDTSEMSYMTRRFWLRPPQRGLT